MMASPTVSTTAVCVSLLNAQSARMAPVAKPVLRPIRLPHLLPHFAFPSTMRSNAAMLTQQPFRQVGVSPFISPRMRARSA